MIHVDVPVLRSLAATAVELPTRRPLGTSAKSIDKACLLLIDFLTQDGTEGHACAFCYPSSIARSLVPIVAELGGQLSGRPLLPVDLADAVSRYFRLPGLTGPLAMVASSVDSREVSSHLFPEVSAHLLAATPGRHWLEYVDWADPILQEPLRIKDGMAIPSSVPGNGLAWDLDVVAKHRLSGFAVTSIVSARF